uniref:Uncharacterized protein n=1 Tax=Arundo donax TaxID=35708 RepID=A0A0A9CBF7_ARUDO
MSLLHESVQKGTTILNITLLQMRPNSLGCFKLPKTHNHGLLNTIDHGSHYFPIISLPCFDVSSITIIRFKHRCIIF